MVTEPRRGEVWWGEFADAGRRPYLVLTRNRAIPVLGSVLVVPVTRSTRGIPTELPLGPADGMPVECAASFDNLGTVPKANLVERMTMLDHLRMIEACAALRAAVDC